MKAIRRSGICTLALYLLCSVTAGATPSTAQAPNKRVVEKLAQGKPLVREIGPGETHVYKVAAPRKHVITGTIQQQGVDVVVRVVNPRGATVSTNDSPNGAEGPEPWSFEAKAAGTWRIEVSPLAEAKRPGQYEARIDEVISFAEHEERKAKQHYQSPRMLALWREFQKHGPAAVERFAKEVKGHAPIVEPLPDAAEGDVLITFVCLVPKGKSADLPGGPSMLPETPLLRFQNTDLMYLTLRCPSDARFSYLFKIHSDGEFERTNAAFEKDAWNPHEFAGASTIELPLAPAQPYLRRAASAPAGRLVEATVPSDILKAERKIAVYVPHAFQKQDGAALPCCVFLDGEAYGHWPKPLIPTPVLLDNLIAQGKLPPLLAILVDSGATRNRDLLMDSSFADFLAKELVPWVRQNYGAAESPGKIAIAGSSAGGLCAAFTALRHPDVFGNVLSQSGAFWYAPGVLEAKNPPIGGLKGAFTYDVARSAAQPVRFWMEVGLFEGPEQLIENRRMRDVLLAKGFSVEYHEFAGDHDYICWRGSLADGLMSLLGCSGSSSPEQQSRSR